MNVLMPLFPLQLVVYPGEDLNLHIFEPRYKELIKECEEQGITFCIPAFIEGMVKEIGTEVQLLGVEKRYPNGELDIKTKGIGLFRIQKIFRKVAGKLYSAAEGKRLVFDTAGDLAMNEQILELLADLFSLLKIAKAIPEDPGELLTYHIAHQVGFSIEQEYEFLCILEESRRQEFLLRHLEKLLPIVRDMENLKQRVKMNGHFRNITPPDY